MKLKEAIHNISDYSEEAIFFAERINGEFRAESGVVALELNDDELAMQLADFAKIKAPGKEYFLEVSIIADMVDGLDTKLVDKLVDRIIYYAENDA